MRDTRVGPLASSSLISVTAVTASSFRFNEHWRRVRSCTTGWIERKASETTYAEHDAIHTCAAAACVRLGKSGYNRIPRYRYHKNCPPSEYLVNSRTHRPERRVQSTPGHAWAALSDSGLLISRYIQLRRTGSNGVSSGKIMNTIRREIERAITMMGHDREMFKLFRCHSLRLREIANV
jgi:hypothetical protein